ncbi:tetraspanin-8 isoform X2 [Talpa occidentalis]|uniref:tetraspanin-8 isoform X2 n=1 Tax=Talpa occidentalis TaxID=50954 RepID=UPI00188F184F|nr:tetraspanin-8 isoform X2 [Talpa occidentalis]
MGGVNVCIKHAMFTFNFIFWILGEGIYDINPHVAMNMLIVVGAVITILGFLGCCGTVAENRFVLFVYFVGLFLIMMMQLSAGFLTVNFRSKTEHILNEILYENVVLLTATDDAGKTFQTAVAMFQEKFKCCGLISGPSDWGDNFQNYFMTCTCTGAPILCTSYQGKLVFKQPCAPLIKKVVSDRVEIILWLAFGLAVFEVLGLIFSMVLVCQIRKR